MKTSKSPRKVLLVAYQVGKDALPDYAHRYSPKTYTLAQLFGRTPASIPTRNEAVTTVIVMSEPTDMSNPPTPTAPRP